MAALENEVGRGRRVSSLNACLWRSRTAITALMSISLNVVSIAAVLCTSTSRLAIVARRFDMRTRSSVRSPSARRSSRTGVAGFGSAFAWTGAGRDAAAFDAAPRRTQPRRRLHDAPGVAGSRHLLEIHRVPPATLRAAGVAPSCRRRPFASRALGALRALRVDDDPSTSPTFTSRRACAIFRSTPPCGARPRSICRSRLDEGLDHADGVPLLLSHFATSASTTPPTSGTTTLAGICPASSSSRRRV